jgi:predicted dienelactone hydrolase
MTYTAPTTHPLGDLTVTITATSLSNTAAFASATATVPGIRVTVEPQSVEVPVGTTAEFTATVINDPADAGVTWSVACSAPPPCDAGTVLPTTSRSEATVVYTAPSTPPPGSVTVNIVATSVGLPSAWGVATITFPPVTTSVTPISALLPLSVSQEFIATVGNDTASNGVTWTLWQDGPACAAECGNVSPLTTASGAPTTYTAPASLPATPPVEVIATSVTDPSMSDSSKVTITAGSVKLVPADMSFKPDKRRQTATLTNTGSSSLTVRSITIEGKNPTEFRQTNTCGNTLGAGDSCTIAVTYIATKKYPRHTAVVEISDSSIDSPQQLHLTGTTKYTLSSAMGAALGSETTAAVPKPTGSRTVGTRSVHLVDSTRRDPYLPNGTMRELMVRFWYPAASDTHCVPADYTSPGVRSYVSQLLRVSLPLVSTNSCLDARIAEGVHPIVVFTHGFTGTFTDYTFLFEDLASRGYVVASIDHTHEATAVEFPDGRLEKSVFGSYLTSYTRSDPEALDYAVTVRLDDLKFVIDELQRLNARANGAFTARLDLSRLALAGHSLGGLTTIVGVEREARLKAGVVLDGLMPVTQVNRTETALLMVAAGREQWDDNECRLWDQLGGPRAALNMKDADHFAFSDAVWLASNAIGTGEAGPAQTVAAIRDYVAAFLDTHLQNKAPSPLLAKASAQYPSAVLAGPQQALCSQQ